MNTNITQIIYWENPGLLFNNYKANIKTECGDNIIRE